METRKLKIVHLITDLDIGGAETMLLKLVSGMDNSSFNNIVVSLSNKGALGNQFESLGIPVIAIGLNPNIPNPVGLLRLYSIFIKERPNILQTWLYHADLVGSFIGLLANIPAIIWNVRCSNMNIRTNNLVSGYILKFLSKLSSFPKLIIINSESGRRDHVQLGYSPKKWILIPNGFDTYQFTSRSIERDKLRNDLGLGNEKLIIGNISRFHKMKDHGTFLSAVKILTQQYSNIHFVLVGSGINNNNKFITGLIQDLEISRYVSLLGERTDVANIIPGFDILSLSSAYGEGFPNVIGEAMSCGVPCVVTDVGDSAQIVGNTGRVVPPKNPEKMAEAWSDLIKRGPEYIRKLGLAARHHIEKNYNLQDVIKQYESIYMEIGSQTIDSSQTNE